MGVLLYSQPRFVSCILFTCSSPYNVTAVCTAVYLVLIVHVCTSLHFAAKHAFIRCWSYEVYVRRNTPEQCLVRWLDGLVGSRTSSAIQYVVRDNTLKLPVLYKYLYIFFYLGDFLFFFFKEHRVTNTRTRLLVLVSPPHQVRTAADTAGNDIPWYTPFCPCLIGLPHTRSGSPLTSSIPLPVMLRAV